jgi:hypothetical protein
VDEGFEQDPGGGRGNAEQSAGQKKARHDGRRHGGVDARMLARD